MCVGDHHAYDDDEGDDDEIEASGDGSGRHDNNMASSHHYPHHRHHDILPPVPVDPQFNPRHSVDPSRRLPAHRPSTRRRPMMYTAASPVIYTTPGHVYFPRPRDYVDNSASVSTVVSLLLVLAVVAAGRLTVVCDRLSAVS